MACLAAISFYAHVSFAQTLHTFMPSQADPLVTADNSANYAYINTSVSSNHKLFLFFPGSGADPIGYRYILQTAANLGYNALGLTYVNDTTVATLCSGQNDSCEGFERMEVFLG